MSREFITEVLGGRIAWEGYKHSFNDLETTNRARAAGRYHWCEDARVYHAHWLFGDRKKDDTDTRRLPLHPGRRVALPRA
jgi:GT2 family glycosyltransferase